MKITFHVNHLTNDSHEMSTLILFGKKNIKMPPAADVISTFRDKCSYDYIEGSVCVILSYL